MRPSIVRHRLDGWVGPELAFREWLASEPSAFWLDAGIHADSGMSFMGRADEWITGSVARGTVTRHPVGDETGTTVLDYLRSRLDPLQDDTTAHAGSGLPIGWVGWLGYELRAQTMGVPIDRSAKHPDALLLRVDRIVAFDHGSRTIDLVALGGTWTPELVEWRDSLIAVLEGLRRDLASTTRPATSTRAVPASPATASPAAGPAAPRATWRDDDESYLAKVAACQREISEGEAYQLCLTTEATVDAHPDPALTYLALRESSPTGSGGYLRAGGVALLSASPERFLSVDRAGIVETRPIKGTRARGRDAGDDERLRDDLMSSEKERAENLMIVDLMRNDLGRVCEVGSVAVPVLLEVETYAHVHQLVSTVRGRLAAGRHPLDAVEACFPAGSMTGAPKLRATQLLDEFEERARGIYSGAFGYVGDDGSIDLAMVIRSIVLDSDGATIGSGGGITAMSDPADELAEVKLKAAALLAVLGT